MRVLCIDSAPRSCSLPGEFKIVEGDEYTVISQEEGLDRYGNLGVGWELAEFPGGLYDPDRFLILGGPDDTLTQEELELWRLRKEIKDTRKRILSAARGAAAAFADRFLRLMHASNDTGKALNVHFNCRCSVFMPAMSFEIPITFKIQRREKILRVPGQRKRPVNHCTAGAIRRVICLALSRRGLYRGAVH